MCGHMKITEKIENIWLLAKKKKDIYNGNEGLPIHPSFFNKFCLFNVNLTVQVNYPKGNDKKELIVIKLVQRMLILED